MPSEKHSIVTDVFRHQYLIILAILWSFASLPINAQNYPDAWEGTLDVFQYDQGILSYRDDGVSGKASIHHNYAKPRSGYLIWSFGTLFETPPTTQNSFSLTLFSIQQNQALYQYVLEPSPDSKEILLLKKNFQMSSGVWDKISQETLDRHMLRFASTAWNGLEMRVIYEEGIGLVMQTFSPHGELQTSKEVIQVEQGMPVWKIKLQTQFTAKKKLQHSYMLPVVTDEVEEQDESPLKIIDSKVDELGEVILKMNKSVNTSQAIITCDGHHPTIANGSSPDILIIQLGEVFQANTEYRFIITDLINLQGEKESLEFTIMGKSEDESTIEIPQGIFITELMVDPPTSGSLRDIKYIELYNNSGEDIDLGYLTLLYRNTKYELPHSKWANHTFAVAYPEANTHPTNIGLLVPLTNFPALSGTFTLRLADPDGNILDQINYSNRLYGEGFPHGKASVERVGYKPDRWLRSNHPNGGTPGLHTTMRPHVGVEARSVVINELMLSPSGTAEKYIELYNRSSSTIDVSELYLTYANKEEASSSKSWLPVINTFLLKPGEYVVLSSFPESLARIFPDHDANTFVERIDFPSISSTYSEIELRSHADDKVIDRVIYRRQWLGDDSRDRTGYSLERISPDHDGTVRNNWRRARSTDSESGIGGTPGVKNSVFGIPSDTLDDRSYISWPDTPEINDIKELYIMLQRFGDLAKLDIYTIDGAPIYSSNGTAITGILDMIRQGKAPYPTMLMVVHITFTDEEKDPPIVSYSSVWLHHNGG